MNDDLAHDAGHLDPLDPGFVMNRWLHPSVYTPVPDPSRPPGYQAAVRAKAEAQRAILRDAEDAMRASSEPQTVPGESEIDPGPEDDWQAYYREQEAERRAHREYMRYIAEVAEGRGQTVEEFVALQMGEWDPEAEL